MKTKAKLVLALSVLTAGTAVAGATGTFAWFTTNRSATLTYSNVTAYNNHGTLDVKIYNLSDTAAVPTNTPAAESKPAVHSVAGSAKSTTTDISSADGVKLVKPIWTGESGNNKKAEKLVDAEAGEYTTYYFTVANTGTGSTALNVFLDAGTCIKASAATETDVQTKNAALAKYSRFAINYFGETAPKSSDPLKAANTKTVENASATSGQYIDALTPENLVVAKNLPTEVKSFVGALPAVSSETATSEKSFLTKIAPGKTQYFTVTVWLEGTKGDGTDFNACAGGSIDVDIVLAAFETAA